MVFFLGSGYYLYIEASSPGQPNDTARLLSPLLQSTNLRCLQFWYHMYGFDVDNFNVYKKSSGKLGNPVWTRRGNQGNIWRHATVSITSQNQYQIVFEGVIGKSYRGDIALDDVTLQKGQCPSQSLCTFDDPGLCGWRNVQGDNFDWTRSNSGTSSFGTGPSNDHTYGTDQGI